MNVTRNIFPKRDNANQVSPQFATPVIEQVGADFYSSTFTAGTDFTVSAGAAGATLKIQLPVAPILGNFGRTGSKGNSSLVIAGLLATTLATEVAFVADTNNQGGSVTGLSNGEYMVDYEAGIIYGKRADAAVAGTIAYNFWARRKVQDLQAPGYEDGTNNVAAVVHKPLANDDYTWTKDFSTALEKSRVVSAVPATVKNVYVRIDSSYATDDLWIHVGNNASLPADGAIATHLCTPVKIQHVTGTDSERVIEFGDEGRFASTGLTIWVSTTEFDKTLIGSSKCVFDVEFIA